MLPSSSSILVILIKWILIAKLFAPPVVVVEQKAQVIFILARLAVALVFALFPSKSPPDFIKDIKQSFLHSSRCNLCNGKGQIVKEVCSICSGKKLIRESTIVRVDIEKGMKDGSEIIFEGDADQSPDLPAGDVKFIINTVSHEHFQRRGDDLYLKYSISLKESLVGFSHKMEHLDGHEFEISRNNVTMHG
jgi:hypothetical protein